MSGPQYDIIIAGSGPAGSTAATLLAQHNHRILMLERSEHPRFHIGESMLPMSTPIFERLGINWDEQCFLRKNGAAFIDENSGKQIRFALNGRYQPYQVERSIFDKMLADNAVKHGAILQQNESVKSVNIDSDAVEVCTDLERYSSRYFIDATGRSTFMGRKHTGIKRIENLGCYAIFTHFCELKSALAQEIFLSGDIKILMLDIGWIWVIPLVNNRISVGIVVQRRVNTSQRRDNLFNHYRDASPYLTELLADSKQEAELKTEADFSFSNTKRFGERYVCCGDAAGFIDPIFSSGVFLAVTSAERAADRLHVALASNTENDPMLHAMDDNSYALGFKSMRLFVERFYQHEMVHRLFFESEHSEEIKHDITALLSGDLWSEYNSFQKMLLGGRQNRSLDNQPADSRF